MQSVNVKDVQEKLSALREKQPELVRRLKAKVKKLCSTLESLPLSETVANPSLYVEAKSKGREGMRVYPAFVVEGNKKTVYVVYCDVEGNEVERKELSAAPAADLVEISKIIDEFVFAVQAELERVQLKEVEEEYVRAVEFADACVNACKAFEKALETLTSQSAHLECEFKKE